METILVVEDDRAILDGLCHNLRFEGFQVLSAIDGERGLELAVDRRPDLILLDIMLPRLSGFELMKTIQRHGLDVPVIMLTAKDQQVDKIMGLDLGADDYITKPFALRELLARINAVLRRKRRFELVDETRTFGDVAIDFSGRTVLKGTSEIKLSDREFRLLALLVRHTGRVLDRQKILNDVWGFDYFGTARTIDNFITRLRSKLEDDPNEPRLIHTIRGVGYKFDAAGP
jgi:DNA-binding response OmpR family regulator